MRRKGNKKMSFLPRQTSKLFDIYFILFVVSIYGIFFPNNFRCIKMSRKREIFHNEKDGSQQFPHYSTPLFFVCVRLHCGGAHLRRLLQKLSGLLNAPQRTEEAENRRGTRRKSTASTAIAWRAERFLYGRKGERIGGLALFER